MGNSRYMRVLWKTLPPEMLENVLACLPLHVLCRFRLVCKAWNHLISQPRFASLRVHMSCTPSSILILPKVVSNFKALEETSIVNGTILDANEKRSYIFSNSFLTTLDSFFWQPRWCKYILIAQGGLIYTMYSTSFSKLSPRHVVCNLVDKSFREIPEPKINSSCDGTIVVMSVDKVKKAYQIITIAKPNFELQGPQVFLFESVTSKWRKLEEDIDLGGYCVLSSVFKNGILYNLLIKAVTHTRLESLWPTLYSCNVTTDVWRKVDVELPLLCNRQNKALLVVSLNRLFMVEYTGFDRRGKKQVVSLTIWEIALEKKVVLKLGHLPEILQISLYDVPPRGGGRPRGGGCYWMQ